MKLSLGIRFGGTAFPAPTRPLVLFLRRFYGARSNAARERPFGSTWDSATVQTRRACVPLELDVCRFQHSSQSSLFPSSTFMDSAFLLSLLRSPVPGQRDGCCVISVIVLILPFSERAHLCVLLPNVYWLIICILYMITSPLPAVGQLWGSHFPAGCRRTCCYFDSTL